MATGIIEKTSDLGIEPIQVKSLLHQRTTGEVLLIRQVKGNLAANGIHSITVLDEDWFSLDGTIPSGDYDTTSTPTWDTYGDAMPNIMGIGTNDNHEAIVWSPAHGLNDRDRIEIADYPVQDADGQWSIVRIDADHFSLVGVNWWQDFFENVTEGEWWQIPLT